PPPPVPPPPPTRGVELAQDLLTTISVATLLLAIAVLVVQALARGRVSLSLVAAAVIIGSVISTEVLKDLILARPEFVSSPLDGNSFPSGHTTVSFSVGVAATLVVPESLRNRVALLAVIYGGAIGVSTLAAGWHRPSDALGAYLITIAWAAAVVAVAGRLERRDFIRSEAWPRIRSAAGFVGAASVVLVIGFLLALLVALAGAVGITDWTKPNAAFLAACAGLVASAAVLMAALIAALHASLGPAAIRTTAPREDGAPR
ncbi:MAG: phosphatase PAP2 family protein, partial [Solirubrobacterales bacterium]